MYDLKFLISYLNIFLVFISKSGVLCDGGETCNTLTHDLRGLKCSLLQSYDPLEKPVKNFKDKINITIEMLPYEINLADENDQLSLTSWMFMNWNDVFLIWDPDQYNGIEKVTVDCKSIWIPDLISLSVLAEDPHQSASHMLCNVQNNGSVSIIFTTIYNTYCTADRTYWPFDEHTCKLNIGSREFSGPTLNITLKPLLFGLNKNSKVWNIKKFSAAASILKTGGYINETYTRFEMTILLKRHASVFKTTFVFPGIGMAIIILAVLWLDVSSPERIYMLTLVIFNDIMFLEYFSYLFPASGTNPPLLVIFFRDSVAISGICIIITIISRILLNAVSKPFWLTSLIKMVNDNYYISTYLLLNITSENTEIKDVEDENPSSLSIVSQKQKDWKIFVILLDRLLFILFTLVYLYLILRFYPAI